MKKSDLIQKLKQLEGITLDEKAYLINLVNTKKKYGLVWEDKPEDVEEQLRDNLPVIKEMKGRAIVNGEDYPNHLLIEGDNLHALISLTFTHEGKIDVIYIDPPYNRGETDFIYNDKYVDKEDTYRHSKWLSFMSKRLEIAKQLLSTEGILFISIDKNEVAQLKLLMDEIFSERNYIEIFSWVKTETPSNLSNKSKEKIEYILCYQKQQNSIRFKGLMKTSSSDNPMMKHQNLIKDLRFKPGQLNIKINEPLIKAGKYGTSKYDIELLNDLQISNGTNKNETALRGKFIWTQNNLEDELIKGSILTIKTKTMILSYEKTEYDPEVPPNLIDRSCGVGTNENAESELIALDLNEFDYPKPTSLINYLLKFNGKRDGVILDFFAGSGTTLDAIIKLNAEDEGTRIGILCNNNQNGIAENICFERNKRRIKGYVNKAKELQPNYPFNNLRYFQCFSLNRAPSLKNRKELAILATELLCVREDIYKEINSIGDYSLNISDTRCFQRGKLFLLVIYNEEVIEHIVDVIKQFVIKSYELKPHFKIYVFSNGPYPYTEEFEEVLEYVTLCALPDAIYKAFQNVLPKRRREAIPELEESTAEDVEISMNIDQ